MSEIQVDGYIRVPKGTMVYPTGDGVEAPATRDQVVKVANIFDVDVKSENFYLLLPDEMRLRYFEASGGKRPIDQDILEFADRLTKGDYRAVEWSSKWALIADVQPAETSARAKVAKKADKPEKKPVTKQQQMVIGSVWTFTQNAELRYKVRNPAYAVMRDDIESSLRQMPSHARKQTVDAKLSELGMIDYIDEAWGPVMSGETFTVRSKLTSGFAGEQDVPMLFRGEKFTLPYASLEPFIELVIER
ncbi:hypothetical protein [Microvirga sp. BSC39]|jgi:hypothetical protein|uniref:hypothetical protein n=1 Tax=Microvirga sp. BSC39 TaxID=1549810 RepID=UPI0004E86950|nr:hypothetical protein [Microvirga sp. BSC39]KFG70565.1 hypothetical protein JH26_03480 [Microvirga sp. BSC39]